MPIVPIPSIHKSLFVDDLNLGGGGGGGDDDAEKHLLLLLLDGGRSERCLLTRKG